MNRSTPLAALAATLVLGACATDGNIDSGKVDYRSATKAPSLAVPPDLTQISNDSRYNVPGQPVTASEQKRLEGQRTKLSVASSQMGDVRVERSGSQRWLVVDRTPEALWEPLKSFWIDNGFVLAKDEAELGILETDWAENRAKIPQDMLRTALGKWFDRLYSTPERDKFRTRLERNAAGGTEIYISHRGMIEIYTSEGKDKTIWQPRPTDPELEAEFLRRLMVRLGVSPEQSQTLVASSTQKQTTAVTTVDGQPVIALTDNFDKAWRRVGLVLDRTGFTVEDRDRKKGLYFVRYVSPDKDNAEPSMLKQFFTLAKKSGEGSVPKTPFNNTKYQIALRETDGGSGVVVQVLNDLGVSENTSTAERILKIIADDLQ